MNARHNNQTQLTRVQIIEITDKDVYSVLFVDREIEQVEGWGNSETHMIEGIFDECFDDALAIYVTNFAARSVSDVTAELAEKAFAKWNDGSRSPDEYDTLPKFIQIHAEHDVEISRRRTLADVNCERRHVRGLRVVEG
jgi:hypothetical protein